MPKIRSAIAAAGVLLLGLTACAGDAAPADSDEEVVFVQAMGMNPDHLNPNVTLNANLAPAGTILEGLVYLSGTFEILPGLAKSWEMSDDGLELTLNLEEDVEWHDGEPFTSADVKYNLEEVMKMHPSAGVVAGAVDSVETPDENTAVVMLNRPVAPFMEALTSLRMLPAHLYEGTEIGLNPANVAPVGTGPYVFEEFISGDRITVVKNEDYWGDAGEIDRIVFKIMPDSNARVLALQSGEIDFVGGTDLDPAQLGNLQADEKLNFPNDAAVPVDLVLFFNVQNEKVADVKLREALYRAIDREAIAENAFYSAQPSESIIPKQMEWAFVDSPNFQKDWAFDPDEAERQLDELGYPRGADGKRMDISLTFASGYATWAASAEIIKSNLDAIGVETQLNTMEMAVFVDKVYKNNDFEMVVMQFGTTPDPNLGIARQYVCNPDHKPYSNPTTVCDDEVDSAFGAAAIAPDRDERKEHLTKAQERVAELFYTVPLVEFTSPAAMSDRFGNLEEFERHINHDHTKLTLNK